MENPRPAESRSSAEPFWDRVRQFAERPRTEVDVVFGLGVPLIAVVASLIYAPPVFSAHVRTWGVPLPFVVVPFLAWQGLLLAFSLARPPAARSASILCGALIPGVACAFAIACGAPLAGVRSFDPLVLLLALVIVLPALGTSATFLRAALRRWFVAPKQHRLVGLLLGVVIGVAPPVAAAGSILLLARRVERRLWNDQIDGQTAADKLRWIRWWPGFEGDRLARMYLRSAIPVDGERNAVGTTERLRRRLRIKAAYETLTGSCLDDNPLAHPADRS